MDKARKLVSIVSHIFSPIEGRECGACYACCITPKIDTETLQKEANTRCGNLSNCSKCRIYENRPTVCRNWFCAWRRFAQLDESLRPDRSGLFAYLHFGRHYLEQPCLIVSLTDKKNGRLPFGHPLLAKYGALGQSIGLPVLYKFRPGAAVYLDGTGNVKPSSEWPSSNPFDWHAYGHSRAGSTQQETSMPT